MKKLESVDAQNPEFTQLLTQLETILRDHVSDEENEQFPFHNLVGPGVGLVDRLRDKLTGRAS